MKLNLGTKIFLSYLLVLLVGALVLLIVAQVSLPGAYGRTMGGTINAGPGHGLAGTGGETFLRFRSGFYIALAWGGLSALVVALFVSLFISRGLAAPLMVLTAASRRVADGHYSERVPARGGDELGQLAGSFNSMSEKLEQVEAMRRRLIGDVAHELRTPLTAIKGSMEGLVDGVLPASHQTFGQVAAEADRLSRLVDDLQELSRVESGAVPLEVATVSLPEIIETARRRLAGQFTVKGVNLVVDLPAGLPAVPADTDRLLQVITNLLNNALQYTPRGGNVTIRAEKRNGEVVFHVKDSGIGIPPEHVPYLFDRFYRVDKSRSRQAGGGSGIGLTICKHLVEAHGGRIWVESNGESQGSTFSFTLPVE
jgi:signal transduction histidine kinase